MVVLSFVFEVSADYGGHDLFTSLSQLHELWKNEQTVIKDMKTFLDGMEAIQDHFKRWRFKVAGVEISQ